MKRYIRVAEAASGPGIVVSSTGISEAGSDQAGEVQLVQTQVQKQLQTKTQKTKKEGPFPHNIGSWSSRNFRERANCFVRRTAAALVLTGLLAGTVPAAGARAAERSTGVSGMAGAAAGSTSVSAVTEAARSTGATPSDVKNGRVFPATKKTTMKKAIQIVTDKGIMEPYFSGSFGESERLSGGEFAAVLSRLMNLPVSTSDELAEMGVLKTREAFIVSEDRIPYEVICRTVLPACGLLPIPATECETSYVPGITTDDGSDAWASARQAGLLSEDTAYPAVTRGDLAVLIARLLTDDYAKLPKVDLPEGLRETRPADVHTWPSRNAFIKAAVGMPAKYLQAFAEDGWWLRWEEPGTGSSVDEENKVLTIGDASPDAAARAAAKYIIALALDGAEPSLSDSMTGETITPKPASAEAGAAAGKETAGDGSRGGSSSGSHSSSTSSIRNSTAGAGAGRKIDTAAAGSGSSGKQSGKNSSRSSASTGAGTAADDMSAVAELMSLEGKAAVRVLGRCDTVSDYLAAAAAQVISGNEESLAAVAPRTAAFLQGTFLTEDTSLDSGFAEEVLEADRDGLQVLANGELATEENVMAIIRDLRKKYPSMYHYEPYGEPYTSPGLGLGGIECAKLAVLLSDEIFGTTAESCIKEDKADIQPGDVLHFVYGKEREHWVTVTGVQRRGGRTVSVQYVEGGPDGIVHWRNGMASVGSLTGLEEIYSRYPEAREKAEEAAAAAKANAKVAVPQRAGTTALEQ